MTTVSLNRSWTTWACPAGLMALFVALCAQTWRRWPDLLIDFGRELYVPWQLADGAVLYRDIAYFNGPFSPYFNAILFRCFGPSLSTLVVANLAIIALITVVLYQMISSRYGRPAGTLVCSVFMCGFSFAHLRIIGNYNFVCPYSHEMTHGIALSLFALALLTPQQAIATKWRVSTAGLLWGLVFLGKPEVFLALSCGVAVLLGTRFVDRSVTWKQACWSSLLFLLGGAVAVLFMAAFLCRHLPVSEAFLSIAGAWRWLLTSEVRNQTFYEKVAGLDEPWWNVIRMLAATLSVACVFAAATLLDRWKARNNLRDLFLSALLFACAAFSGGPLLLNERSLLVVSMMIFVYFGFLFCRNVWRQSNVAQWAVPLAWSTFALLMLTKLLLAPKFYHYGFGLAMPATLLGVLIAVVWLPTACCRSWQGGKWFRIAVFSICIMDLGSLVHTSSLCLKMKTLPVGEGKDQIVGLNSDLRRDATLAQTIDFLSNDIPPEATVAALPEGIMLNYQARRVNPTGFINLMPPELEMFGEETIIRSFAASPPDYVLLVHKETEDYGVRFFGSDGYGEQIMQWVLDHYTPVQTLGAEPLRNKEFGVKILERNKRPAGTLEEPALTMN
jgi:hypothetical protein